MAAQHAERERARQASRIPAAEYAGPVCVDPISEDGTYFASVEDLLEQYDAAYEGGYAYACGLRVPIVGDVAGWQDHGGVTWYVDTTRIVVLDEAELDRWLAGADWKTYEPGVRP